MKLYAVTACPSGVAHTYMAAEALQKAAKGKGIEIKVETQGSMGVENEITEEEARDADVVLLVTDVKLKNLHRFSNVPKLKVSIHYAVRHADKVIAKAMEVYEQNR